MVVFINFLIFKGTPLTKVKIVKNHLIFIPLYKAQNSKKITKKIFLKKNFNIKFPASRSRKTTLLRLHSNHSIINRQKYKI